MFRGLWNAGGGEQAFHKLVFIHRLHKAGISGRPLGLALRQKKKQPSAYSPPTQHNRTLVSSERKHHRWREWYKQMAGDRKAADFRLPGCRRAWKGSSSILKACLSCRSVPPGTQITRQLPGKSEKWGIIQYRKFLLNILLKHSSSGLSTFNNPDSFPLTLIRRDPPLPGRFQPHTHKARHPTMCSTGIVFI